jgi:uncharacterized protein (TIGR03435 family)
MFGKQAILSAALLAAVYGQPSATTLQYGVTSIKPDKNSDARLAFRIDANGNLTATAITLKRLMMTAYSVQGFRIVGGPRWIDSSRWDIRATHDGAATAEESHVMLRALLAERFRLRVHDDSRRQSVYELVADRGSPRVAAAKDTSAKPIVRAGPGLVDLTNATAATFASQLSYSVARPVIDRTGLSGLFDFRLEWTPEPGEDGGPTTAGLPATVTPPPSSSGGPTIFTAIREQLGLQLKPARGPVGVVVIDGVELPRAD